MNVVEKRDFIHRYLHNADESLINSLYETLQKNRALKQKLTNRAQKSEQDIKAGRVFSREELEQKML
ncbi:MAG: hypothetical protein PF489_02645 [Salinivirgaceae bacterium]|nr:hypothetical protein [Salinivirgaceae bacterium]